MANTEVGAAYVSIMPSMKGFGSEVASGVSGAFSGASGIIKGIMGAAATASAISFGKSALDAYSSYEQAVGGVDTLFKESSDRVQQYAAGAFQTAGVSATSYMEQATSMAASLVSGLGGDTQQAADLVNMAVVDMSDNANKMGTDLGSIQGTYQSLMRGNYAMLDNLKLGYGGTKAELQRLISDSSKMTDVQKELGVTVDGSSMSFDNVVKAIHVMQASLGIAGTTAKEAATTIEGSVNQMKASWTNWITGLGRDDADMNALTGQLVDSVITAASNVLPRIAQIAKSLVMAIGNAFVTYGPQVATIAKNALTQAILSAALSLNDALAGFGLSLPPGFAMSIVTGINGAFDGVKTAFTNIVSFLNENKAQIAGAVGGIATAFVVFNGGGAIATALQGLGPMLTSAAGGASFFVTQFMGIARLQGVGAAIGAVVNNVKLLGTSFLTSIGPIGIVIGIVAALAAAFVYFYTTNSQFAATINGIFSTMGAVVGPIIQSIVTTLQNFAAAVLPMIMSALSTIAPVIMQIVTIVAQLASILIPIILQIVATVVPILTQIVTIIIQIATQIISAVMPVVQTILTTIQTAMPLIQTIVTTVMNVILGIIQTVWPVIQGIIQGVMSVIQGIMDTVWPAVQSIVETVMGVIQGVIQAIMQAIQGDWSGAWETIKSTLKAAWDGIKNAVQDGINAVVNFVSGLPGKILGAIGDLGNLLFDAGASLLNGLVNGIKSVVGSVIDTVSGVVGQIRGLFPFSPAKYGPFSGHGYTTYSGKALMTDFGASMEKYGARAIGAASDTMGRVHDAFSGQMTDISDPLAWGGGAKIRVANAGRVGNLALAGVGAGDTNVYLNDVNVNDRDEITQVTRDYLSRLKRLNAI